LSWQKKKKKKKKRTGKEGQSRHVGNQTTQNQMEFITVGSNPYVTNHVSNMNMSVGEVVTMQNMYHLIACPFGRSVLVRVNCMTTSEMSEEIRLAFAEMTMQRQQQGQE
jgi:hypothetical protein